MLNPNTTPPVLAGQARASDPEIAKAQETMATVFQQEQNARAQANESLNTARDNGEDVQLHVYKNRLPSCHYVFKDGSQATFVNGEYKTANEYEVQQLDAEVKRGHPHIFIDKTNAVVSSKLDADPMAALREKIRAEIIAEQAPKDFGSNQTGQNVLKPAGTNQVAAAVAGGVSSTGQPIPAALKAALNSPAAGTGQ